MNPVVTLIALTFVLQTSFCQQGFPAQFQTRLNISGMTSSSILSGGIQDLLFDLTNGRARFDIQGWRAKQKEAYVLINKPKGAEADSPAAQGYTMFNFNPDYPAVTKNNCWYRTNPMTDIGPFPWQWTSDSQGDYQIQPWFPLPADLINKGEVWVPEIQATATRYDSTDICNLVRSGIGKVPCLSYFEMPNRPVKTIQARAARGSYDADEYVTTVYQTFTNGIPAEAESLFNLPEHWTSICGNANTGFSIEPARGFVVTPQGQDQFSMKMATPPVASLGNEVRVEFKAQPNWYYNATRCAQFNPIVFTHDNWQVPQNVSMSFVDYGCCSYLVKATGGGYDWQYSTNSFVVYACDGQAGYGCKGREPCGA